MGDELGDLGGLDAVVEREVEVYGISIVWFRAMSAARVARLRSRGERPGRFQTSPRKTSCVYFSSAGGATACWAWLMPERVRTLVMVPFVRRRAVFVLLVGDLLHPIHCLAAARS